MSKQSLSRLIQRATKNIDDPRSQRFLRELGLQSLFLFSRIFIEPVVEPNHKERLSLPKQLFLPLCNFAQDDSIKRKALFMPRSFFKTTYFTEGKSIWDYLRNHEERILIANETLDNAMAMVGHIRDHILDNILLRVCYPELAVTKDWVSRKRFSSQNIELPRRGSYREPTFACIGVGGAAQSRHYTRICLDDLIGKRAKFSPTVRQDTENWFDNVEQLLVQPDDTLESGSYIQINATFWAPHDLYQNLKDRDKRYIFKIIAAENPDGTPVWPERLSAEKISEMKSDPRKMVIYYTQYLNNPLATDLTDFKLNWLKHYALCIKDNEPAVKYEYTKKVKYGKEEKLETKVRIVPVMALNIDGVIDPAFSTDAKKACLTAIVIVGTDPKTNKRIVLEAWGRRIGQPSELYKQVFAFHKKYKCRRWGVEAFGAQQFIAKAIREEAEKRGYHHFPLRELKKEVGKDAKGLRIVSLQDEFSRGDIYVQSDFSAFMREYQSYPMGETQDILDALGWHKIAFNWSRRNKETFNASAEERYQKYLNATRNEFL